MLANAERTIAAYRPKSIGLEIVGTIRGVHRSSALRQQEAASGTRLPQQQAGDNIETLNISRSSPLFRQQQGHCGASLSATVRLDGHIEGPCRDALTTVERAFVVRFVHYLWHVKPVP